MYAIINERGGQRKVAVNEEILIDLAEEGNAKAGAKITFDQVLVVGAVGGEAKIGQPYVKGASVTTEVLEPVVLGEKLDVWKFREKKAWQRKMGHRQRYTKVKVTNIYG